MLHNVCLEPYIWPCLYYCIQRVRPDMSIAEFNALPRHDYDPENVKHIPMGAILWYNNSEKDKEWQLSVQGQIVLASYTFNRGHFMVYEGNGLLSDLSWTDDKEPYIRFRKLAELSPPDKIIVVPDLILSR